METSKSDIQRGVQVGVGKEALKVMRVRKVEVSSRQAVRILAMCRCLLVAFPALTTQCWNIRLLLIFRLSV